ncbi:MAG: hypothetical protein AAF409_00255 [Pseudomonadota bacterium]
MTERIVYFLLHIPKCAGTTVETHFSTYLGPAFAYAPRWISPFRDILGNRYRHQTLTDFAKVRAVSGHSLSTGMRSLFPGAEIRESVLLRDPTGYLLSLYNYRWTRHTEGWGAEPPSFERWYARQRRNPMSRFLLNRYFEQGVPALYRLSSAMRLSYLEERLSRFHFVGSYRFATDMIEEISRQLGLPQTVADRNVNAERKLLAADLPLRMRQRIEAENALDQALFDRWAERRWKGHPDSPAPDLSTKDHARYLLGDISNVILRKSIT